MRNRSFVGAWLAIAGAVCAVVLPRAVVTDAQPPVFGYACQQGCNNANGCSWPFGKYTVWHRHVECRMTIGAITCRNSEEKAPCYTQYVYEHSGCTGRLLTTINTETPNCEAL